MSRFNDAREALLAAEVALKSRIDNNARKMQETKLTLETCEQTDTKLKQRLEDTQTAIRMVEIERDSPGVSLEGQALPDEANVPEAPTEPVEDDVMSDAEFEAQERGF